MARDTIQKLAEQAAAESRYCDDPAAATIYAEGHAAGQRLALTEMAKRMGGKRA